MNEVEDALESAGWEPVLVDQLRIGDAVYGHTHGEGLVDKVFRSGLIVKRNGNLPDISIDTIVHMSEIWWRKPRPTLTIEDLEAHSWRLALDDEGGEWYWNGRVIRFMSDELAEDLNELDEGLIYRWADEEVR